MCRATAALKRIIGIHEYTPSVPLRALVWKSKWHNARGNGHGPGLRIPADSLVERLSREHRIIRQMLADAARRCSRGQG
jgi:hypothetical protein